MDPSGLLTEGGRVLFGYGVLGVVTVALGWVCRRLYCDLRASEKRVHELTVTTTQALSELSRGIEDRNRVLEAVAKGAAEQAAGFSALGDLLKAQHERVLDRFPR